MANEPVVEMQPRPRGMRVVQTREDVLPLESDNQLESLSSVAKPMGNFGNVSITLERELDRKSSIDGPAFAISGNEINPMLRSVGEANGLASFYVDITSNKSLPVGRVGQMTLYIDGVDKQLVSTSAKHEGDEGDLDVNFITWRIEGVGEEGYLLAPFTPEFLASTEIQFSTVDEDRGGETN